MHTNDVADGALNVNTRSLVFAQHWNVIDEVAVLFALHNRVDAYALALYPNPVDIRVGRQ